MLLVRRLLVPMLLVRRMRVAMLRFDWLLVSMLPCFALWSCFPMVLCGRMRVAMLLVRHVARPDGALLCAVELLPDGALRRPWR